MEKGWRIVSTSKIEGFKPRVEHERIDHFTDDTVFALTYICPSPGNCTAISSPDLISLLLSGRTLEEKENGRYRNNFKSF